MSLKKYLVFPLMLALLVGSVTFAVARDYWSRQIGITVNIVGIDAQLLRPDYEGYNTKVVVTSLVNGKVCLSILLENAASVIYLNSNCTGLPVGASWTLMGDYVRVYEKAPWGYYPEGTPFALNGYNVVNKAKMLWGLPGWGLELSFTWDQGSATAIGQYNLVLTLAMGFV